jgi:DNA (cytosine-5)-methyltransferase 1
VRFASVCSGIDSASVAWCPLGWQPVLFSEIAPFPSAVLAHHYPQVPNLGDLNDFRSWPDAIFDVLVGGTPCQSFSVAGFREGLVDPRGNLALVYLEMLRRHRPRWFVWENVPGVLSSNKGRDLGAFFGGVAELGYGYAWRTLNARYFGVPQRRARVFVVGCLGSWARPAAVLLEPESLRGNLAPRRKARADHSGTLTASSRRSSSPEFDNGQLIAGTLDASHHLRPEHAWGDKLLAGTLCPGGKPGGYNGQDAFAGLLIPFDRAQLTHPENRSRPMPGDPAPTLAATAEACVVAIGSAEGSEVFLTRSNIGKQGNNQAPLVAYDAMPARGEGGSTVFLETELAAGVRAIDPGRTDRGTRIVQGPAVRRFTPLECERLQGFPDGYTAIPYRGSLIAADSPRYEAIGNAIAVPCLRWLGERIAAVDLM